MTDAVTIDHDRYMRKLEQEENEQMWQEQKAEEVSGEWVEELCKHNRVEALGMSWTEVSAEAKCAGVTMQEYLLNEAWDMIDKAPHLFKEEPEYYEWD